MILYMESWTWSMQYWTSEELDSVFQLSTQLLSFLAWWIVDVIHVIAAANIVVSWGRGEDGQLGLGDAEDRFSPTQVSALDEQQIVSVTCGADHATAYSEALKQVYSWGW